MPTPIEPRYVRRDRAVYSFALCRACGPAGGTAGPCEVARCKACGTPQCASNGLARGTCAVCFVGLLPGFTGSDRPCRYRHCKARAVAQVGVWSVCATHLAWRKRGYLETQIAARDRHWIVCESID